MNTDPKTLEDTLQAVAAALRDAIRDTPDSAAAEPPEEVHTDLACRFLLRLARQGATILPTSKAAAPNVAAKRAEAAERTLAVLTGWLLDHPECSYVTEVAPAGTFEVTFLDRDDEVRAYFSGTSVQDAYAQAAQTLILDGGAL